MKFRNGMGSALFAGLFLVGLGVSSSGVASATSVDPAASTYSCEVSPHTTTHALGGTAKGGTYLHNGPYSSCGTVDGKLGTNEAIHLFCYVMNASENGTEWYYVGNQEGDFGWMSVDSVVAGHPTTPPCDDVY